MIRSAACICWVNSALAGLIRRLPSAASVTQMVSPSLTLRCASASFGSTTPIELPTLRSLSSRIMPQCSYISYNAQLAGNLVVMLFAQHLREGVRRGRIRCSVRIWTRPQVKEGGRYAMDDGHVVVDSIERMRLKDITYDLARESGFD